MLFQKQVLYHEVKTNRFPISLNLNNGKQENNIYCHERTRHSLCFLFHFLKYSNCDI